MSTHVPMNSSVQSTLWLVLRCVLLALPLWLGLLHLPAPISIEIFDAPSMALDYAVRHGIGLGSALPSSTGPLGALLTNVHSGQPLWLNYWCQSLVGLAFALGLSWIVWRLTPPVRWWFLGALFLIASFRPEYMYVTLLLVGGIMLIDRPVHWMEATGIGFVLGLLALINVHFALFGLVAITLSFFNPSATNTKFIPLFGGATLGLVLISGWFWSGQPAGDLLPWLGHGLSLASLRYQAAAGFWSQSTLVCGVVTSTLIAAMLVGAVIAEPRRWRNLAAVGFVFAVLVHVWRNATGQPGVGPQIFFVAGLMAAMSWLALRPANFGGRWMQLTAIGAAVVAALGLLLVEPRIFTESIILLNQKIVANATALTNRRGWQRSVNDSFKSTAQLFALPRIQAATAGQRTDFLGNAIGYALVNRVDYAPRPGLQSYLVADTALAKRYAAYYSGPSAPMFVVQRLQALDRSLPPLEDAFAQLALYFHYDFQLEENGFVLWQRRHDSAAPTTLNSPVWHIVADWDQPIALPIQPNRAYWLTVRSKRSFTGWLRSQLLSPTDPTLLLRDEEGSVLSYRSAPEALTTGFLLDPLFRGEIDLIRFQAGEHLASIREITLQRPAGHPSDFTGQIEIALHEIVPPAVSGRKESAVNFAQRFRIANRLPVAVSAYFPPQTTNLDGKDVLLTHPDSSLEFPLRSGDLHLQGGFGLLAGAYSNGNATDGVEFVVEYVPAIGQPTILWRRHLDPVAQSGDRGLQKFSVELPQPATGRVILRTQNMPGHNAAWDWSFWADLRFESSPATR